MKRVLVAAILLVLFAPATAGAVDIYLLQYGYEEGIPCPGSGSGNSFTTQYCSRPATFEVFGDFESAKKRLRESSPVAAFKVSCWTFSNSKPSCDTVEMEIVTDKDLRERASKPNWYNSTNITFGDNVINGIDRGGTRP